MTLAAMAEALVETAGAWSPAVAAAQAAARASELSVRRAQLTGRAAATEPDVDQAKQRLHLAVRSALDAAGRAALAPGRAALAHDGAAALHEQLARRGIGDVSWHVEQSRRHWGAAEADRQSAGATILHAGTRLTARSESLEHAGSLRAQLHHRPAHTGHRRGATCPRAASPWFTPVCAQAGRWLLRVGPALSCPVSQ
jgi:hypothetical protein